NLDSATNEARITDPAANDFSLAPGSAAKGTGPTGLDMGGAVPRWVNIAGEPAGTTSNNAATLTVYGPGIVSYFYRVDGGAWISERSVNLPIVLTGLAAGTHSVQVSGRNYAGVFQSLAAATLSDIW